jgi:hypothetical protein
VQLIYRSQITQSPIFIVNDFLTAAECDSLLVKCAGEMLEQSVAAGGTDTRRSSGHIRVIRAETLRLHVFFF